MLANLQSSLFTAWDLCLDGSRFAWRVPSSTLVAALHLGEQADETERLVAGPACHLLAGGLVLDAHPTLRASPDGGTVLN